MFYSDKWFIFLYHLCWHSVHWLCLACCCLLLRRGSGGKVFWWTRLCVCVCLSVHEHMSGTTYAIFTNFSMHVAMAVARSLPDRVTKSQGEETIFGVVRTILRCSRRCRVCYRRDHSVPIMLCSRRDHSVCQTSANRNLENSDCRQCNLLAGNGVMGVHSAGEVSYLRLPRVD